MIVVSEESQRREVEARERARRISAIHDRISKTNAWKVAEEIDDLSRQLLQFKMASDKND